jgi:hypothetical protein
MGAVGGDIPHHDGVLLLLEVQFRQYRPLGISRLFHGLRLAVGIPGCIDRLLI